MAHDSLEKYWCQCNVCLDVLEVKDIRVLLCGHGFCSPCLDRSFSGSNQNRRGQNPRRCPSCRSVTENSKEGFEPFRIFMDFVPGKVGFVAQVVDGLNRMDAGAKVISVQNAEKKLKKAAEEMECENDRADALRNAIEDFKERITPLFADAQAKVQQIASLRSELEKSRREAETLKGQLQKAKVDQDHISNLRKERRQAETERDAALALAEKASGEMVQLRGKGVTLQQERDTFEQENVRLKDQLTRHANAARANKERLRGLKQANATLQADLAHKNSELEESQASTSILMSMDDDDPMVSQINAYSDSSAHLAVASGSSSIRKTSLTSVRSPRVPLLVTQTAVTQHDAPYDDYEGMPRPGFASDWNLATARPQHNLKRKFDGGMSIKNTDFLSVDKKGQPKIPVQLGPRHARRVPQHYHTR